MMIHRIPLLVALCLFPGIPLTADAPAADDGERPATLEQLKAERENTARQEAALLPTLGTFTAQQVIRFELEEGFLILKTGLPDTTGQSRIEIEGLPGVTTVHVQRRPEEFGPDVPFVFHLIHQDFSSPDLIQVQSSVFYSPAALNAARDVESPSEIVSTQLIQSLSLPPGLPGTEDPIRLYVRRHDDSGENTVDLRADARSFEQLHRQHPRVVAQYLQPLLRDLGQGHLFAVDSRVAWQVFPELFQPDDELQRQVEQIVLRLDDEDFQQREQASEALEQLGQTGALMLMTIDRRGLSAEQNARIEAFLEEYRPLEPEEARQYREDSSFLLDLLMSDERIFREVALRQLRDIHDIELEFDLDAGGEERAAQVQRLREQLGANDQAADGTSDPARHSESLEGIRWDQVDQ
jgi:hypothetical protein